MNQQHYVRKLEKSIDDYLDNITLMKEKLAEEEQALQQCLKELRLYEINNEIAIYKEYVDVNNGIGISKEYAVG